MIFCYYGLDKFGCFEGKTVNCDPVLIIQDDVQTVHLGCFNALFITETGSAFVTGFCGFERAPRHRWRLSGSNEEGVITKSSLNRSSIGIVTKDGRLLFWKDVLCQPDLVSTSGPVKDVVLGNRAAVVLHEDGTLGMLHYPTLQTVPVYLNCRIASVACGNAHYLALDTNGQLYSWGNSNHGELGHGVLEAEETPRIVEALQGLVMKSIAAGGWHSAAISECGDLYLWGWNESGQLGLPFRSDELQRNDAVTVLPEPKLFTSLDAIPFQAVGCGSRHTAALTTYGSVYTWGSNTYGQLGARRDIKALHSPHQVQLPDGHRGIELCCKFWGTLVKCVKHS